MQHYRMNLRAMIDSSKPGLQTYLGGQKAEKMPK